MPIHSYSVANIGLYLLIIAALEAQAVYTWQFRKMPGTLTVVFAQLCKMIFLLSLVLASISMELPDKAFWITVQKITATLLPNLWFVFILQISQQKNSISPVLKYCLGGIFCGLSLLLISNWHGLVWQKAWLEGQTVLLVYGPSSRGRDSIFLCARHHNHDLGCALDSCQRWFAPAAGTMVFFGGGNLLG